MEYMGLNLNKLIDYYYIYETEILYNYNKQKINYYKYKIKSDEEILKEHRRINKILRKSLKKSKSNKKFNNYY